MPHPFAEAFIESLKATPMRVVVGDSAFELELFNAKVERATLCGDLRVVIWSRLSSTAVVDKMAEQRVDWIALDAPGLLALSDDAQRSLAQAYVAGWTAAVTARVQRAPNLRALSPTDCVPRVRNCPLRLKTVPRVAADFERLFRVKSRLPKLPA